MITLKNGSFKEAAYYDPELLRKLAYSLPIGVLGVHNMQIEWCNLAFKQMFDPKLTTDFIGKSLRFLSTSSCEEKRLHALARPRPDFTDGDSTIIQCCRQNGQYFLAQFTSWTSWKPVSMREQVLLVQEISQGHLQKCLGSHADFVENIISQDSLDGSMLIIGSRIVYANDRLHKMLGYPKDFLIGLAHWKIYHSDFQIEQRERVRARLCSDQQMSSYPLWLQKSDGSPLPALGIDKKVIYEGQTGLSVSLRDASQVTNLKSEKVFTQFDQNLENILGNIANEFNNSLMIIMGCAQVMNNDPELTSWQQKTLQRVFQASDRARELVRQMVAPTHPIPQKVGFTRLPSIIDQITNFLRNALPQNVEIFYRIETDLDVNVIVEEPTKNEMMLRLPDFAHNVCKLNRPVLFRIGSVTDIYVNTSKANASEILRSILLDITVLHHVEDCPCHHETNTISDDRGSRSQEPGKSEDVLHYEAEESVLELPKFSLSFTVVGPSDDRQLQKKTTALKGTERILLVDDDHNVIDTIKQMLEPLGYRVTGSHGSMEALNTFRNSPQAFDIVLTDLAMPIMTGLFLASELIKLRPSVPIIILTGFVADISIKEAKSMGINTVLVKPFSQLQLASAIRKTLDNLQNRDFRAIVARPDIID